MKLIRLSLFSIVLFLVCVPATAQETVTGRKVLTAPECVINQIVKEIGVIDGSGNINNLLDENITNYATFAGAINATVIASPILTVKDTKHTYASGTVAGFSIVSSGGGSLLSLDLIKAATILLYKGGQLKATIPVREGQSAGVLSLNLINIAGSDEVTSNLSVVSTVDFDEFGLQYTGGVNADVVKTLRIRYAFVGDPVQKTLTKNNFPSVATDNLLNLDKNVIDNDLTNYYIYTPLLSIGYSKAVKIDAGQVIKAGNDIGFLYKEVNILNLSVAQSTAIRLYDASNKQVAEYIFNTNVLGLAVGTGGMTDISIPATVDFRYAELGFYSAISVSLGSKNIYYGYTREKPTVIHHHIYNISAGAEICDSQTTYQLTGTDITWSLVSQPAGANAQVTKAGTVTGMSVNGPYIFRATPTDGCPPKDVTIQKGIVPAVIDPGCNNVLSAGPDNVELCSNTDHGVTGSLISISNLQNKERIIDGNENSYAEYVGGLSLASNLHLVGVKKKTGTFNAAGDIKRVGFMVQTAEEGLGLNALQFFSIRLYKDGQTEPVYNSLIDNSNAISVGLIGSSQNDKMRFSIEVPAGIDFNEISLWTSGLLQLNLSSLRIYYAFTDVNDDCFSYTDPADMCSTTLISAEGTGASFNYDATGVSGLASVTSVMTNLSGIIDGSTQTSAVITGVKLASQTEIAVKTGRVFGRTNQLGIIMDSKTYLAGVGVGSFLTVQTYYKGVATGDEFTNWEVLGADVIGYGDKSYLMMNPKTDFDEVRLIFTKIAGVLDGTNIYGLFVRNDNDEDGIPNCMDDTSCSDDLAGIVIDEICQNSPLHITGKGTNNGTYSYYWEYQGNKIEGTFKVGIDGSFDITTTASATQPGKFTLSFYGEGETTGIYDRFIKSVPFIVHPLQTTWKINPINQNWNEWLNWSDGTPYCCTDVIIPTGAALYPVLTDAAENCCRYIHFEPASEVVNTHNLTYTRAWVDMTLAPNRYYMLSAPLKSMYTGDMFIPVSSTEAAHFPVLDAASYPDNRFNPRIYQRLWEKKAPGKLYDNSSTQLAIATTQWSRHFNSVAYNYGLGTGVSVWVDNGTSQAGSYTFRFPKVHSAYKYYDEYSQGGTTVSENIDRTNAGRFIYEDNNSAITFPLTINLTTDENSEYFLAGNPFMSHIDVAEFLNENSATVASLKLYDGNSSNSAVEVDGQLLSSNGDFTSIAPLQSFFIQAKTAGTTLQIKYTEAMLVSAPTVALRSSTSADLLRITARSGLNSSAVSLYLGDMEGKQSEVLFDGEIKPALTLYAVSGNRAMDICESPQKGDLPLGLYLSESAPVELNFELATNGINETWELVDLAEGKIYLIENNLHINLGVTDSNVARYVVRQASSSNVENDGQQVYVVRNSPEEVTINTTGTDLSSVSVYNVQGVLIGKKDEIRSTTHTIFIPGNGVYILVIKLVDGKEEQIKLLN